MTRPDPPNTDHFDAICAQIEDFEPLPEPGRPALSDRPWVNEDGEEGTAIDGQILAGLVIPV